MPLGVVCHMPYPVAFHGIGYYHDRLVMDLCSPVESVDYLLDSMPVNFKDLPVKRCPLVFCRVKWHDIFGKAILLNPVSIEDRNNVVQLEFSRSHGGFPDLTFIRLAVANQDVDSVLLVIEL